MEVSAEAQHQQAFDLPEALEAPATDLEPVPKEPTDLLKQDQQEHQNQTQTAGQGPVQPEGDLLDEVADMNIPKTINMSYEKEDRADQVVSPDASTFDGTSTIGSATSEPTTETASRSSRKGGKTKKPTSGGRPAGGSRAGSRGGGSRASARSNRKSPNTSSGNGNSQANAPRRNYRNTFGGASRIQNSSVPRPFKRPGPLSYSKAVRLSGTGGPFSAREVDDKTRAVLADMNEFDAAQLETENIASDIF